MVLKRASQRKINWGADAIRGENNPNFSGGQYLDDKGYIRVLAPNHPYQNHRYVYMHRLVVEKHLGRFLQPWEIVHHINEVKLDNRVDNLFLTTVEEHTTIHREGKVVTAEQRLARRNAARKRNADGNVQRVGGKFAKKEN